MPSAAPMSFVHCLAAVQDGNTCTFPYAISGPCVCHAEQARLIASSKALLCREKISICRRTLALLTSSSLRMPSMTLKGCTSGSGIPPQNPLMTENAPHQGSRNHFVTALSRCQVLLRVSERLFVAATVYA